MAKTRSAKQPKVSRSASKDNPALAASQLPHPKSFVPVRQSAPPIWPVKLAAEQQQEVFLLVAYLLDYPSSAWPQLLATVATRLPLLPPVISKQLASFVDWSQRVGQEETEKLYVETFDQKRRCCLELSYYATGDTRQRGVALTIFQDLYAAVGWVQKTIHLPDYLPSVLELASRCSGESLELVLNMIGAHRQGIEVLHAALIDLDSPWAQVVQALRLALPEVDRETYQKMQDLIRQGPPAELVGVKTGQDLPWPSSNSKGGN